MSLSGVVVDKVVTNPPYIVVREPWSSEIRLIVLLDAPMALQRWQTVSVTGFMSTLVTRERALSAAAVSVYTDASGTTALAPLPILPGDQSFTPEAAPPQTAGRGEQQMMEVEAPPLPSGDPPPDEIDYHLATVGEALELDEGDTVELACKPITDTGTDAVDGDYYVIGDDDSTDEIRVFSQTEGDTGQRVVTVTGTVVTDSNDDKVLHVDRGPGTPRAGLVATAFVPPPYSVAAAKSQAVGSAVAVLNAQVALVFSQSECYIQDADAPVGIWVKQGPSADWHAGDSVNLNGWLREADSGERYVQMNACNPTPGGPAPPPMVMGNRTLAGTDWPSAAAVAQIGVAGAAGPNNVGLLVRTSGRVVDIESGLLEIDDGSCDADSCTVWVSLPSGVTPPEVGDFVIVTGASSLTGSSSAPERLVRVATADDIQSGCWDDTDDPVVAITSPGEDGATAETFEAISGTASDTARVVKVEVQINGGSWTEATYSTISGLWSLDWTPERADYTISVRAYDCNGHMTTATRSVSLVDVAHSAGQASTADYMYGTVITWPSTINPKVNGEAGGNGLIRKSGAGFAWDTYGRERLRALRPGSLRFGNSVSNSYRWRFGIGPDAQRPPQQIPGGGNFSLNAYGIGEHLDLCGYLGTDPVLVLPYYAAAGTAPSTTEAANMVLFCTEPYKPAVEQVAWELTRINRHLRQDDRLEGEPCNPDPEGCDEWPGYSDAIQQSTGYAADALVVIDTTPGTGNVPSSSSTRPGVKLVFRCISSTAGLTSTVSAPFYGSSWRSYWKYWEPVEVAVEDTSWTTAELAPEGYWAKMRRLTTGSTDGWSSVRWELGNELFADSAVEAADYNAAVQIIKDIVDDYDAPAPAIAVATPTTREQPVGYAGYTPFAILNPTGGRAYDAVVPHFYCGPAIDVGNSLAALFDTSTGLDLGARHIVGVNIGEYERVCSAGLPPIWATELNTRYGEFAGLDEQQKDPQFPHNFELKSALAAAIMQLDLAAQGAAGSNVFPAVSIQQGSETPGRVFRMIAVDKHELVNDLYPSERRWVTPTYYAHQMLNHLGRGRVEGTQCSASGLFAQAFWDYDTFRLFIINTTETAVPFRASLGADVEVQTGFQHPYVLRLTGENGMTSTNECGSGVQVPAPVFGVDLQGAIEDGIFSGTAPAASMSVYEFILQPSILDLTGVVSTPSGPLAGASVSCQNAVSITDALGRYYFTDLSPGSASVTATANGYIITGEQVTIPATGNGGAWAALDAVPRLSGTVRLPEQQGGEPIPGAAVWVEPSGGGQAIASTVVDCEGNFALPLAAGIYDVHVKHPNYGEPYAFEGTDVTTGPACIAFVLAQDAMPAACQ